MLIDENILSDNYLSSSYTSSNNDTDPLFLSNCNNRITKKTKLFMVIIMIITLTSL